MKRLFYLVLIPLMALLVSCSTASRESAPPGRAPAALDKPVTLVPPYTPAQPGDPTDRVAVQYAVIAIAEQVGLGYDWETSYKNTDPICRRWIKPVIRGVPCREALVMILGPVELTYELRDGHLALIRKQAARISQ